MDCINVFIYHHGKWDEFKSYNDYSATGILVPTECTYGKLVEMIVKELNLDPKRDAIMIQYQVNKNMPLMKISSDSSVAFYLELKKKDKDLTSFPLCVDVAPLSGSNRIVSLEDMSPSRTASFEGGNMIQAEGYGNRRLQIPLLTNLPTIESIASEICESIPTPKEVDSELDSTVITHPTADGIAKNKLFQDKQVLKTSMSLYAIKNNFQYKVFRSSKTEFQLNCLDEKCGWSFRASKVGKTDMFRIRYIKDAHTCPMDVQGEHRQATSSIVASCIKHKYISAKTKYTPADIIKDMMDSHGVRMSYSKAWRAQMFAMEDVRGDPEESYRKLPIYMYMLEDRNPGSFTKIETDESNRFRNLYMALGASRQGWEHCRPVIVVNTTYLASHYGGTLFTACTQDANNNIYILAFGVADSESESSWLWFLMRIKEVYGERDGLCIVSDTHTDIDTAVKKVYPNATHCISSYHLLRKLRANFSKNGNDLSQPFNAAARAYTITDFEYHMNQLDNINKEIRPYLEKIGHHRWSRAHMAANRFSTLTLNLIESVNSVTLAAKNFPIEPLLECLRCMLQNWFCENLKDAESTLTQLATRPENILRERCRESMTMQVHSLSPILFQVVEGITSHLVNIHERTCTCNKFQFDEMPCSHALAIIANRNLHAYCSKYYTKEEYVAAYKGTIHPLGNREDLIIPDDVKDRIVLAPTNRRRRGRPKEKEPQPTGEKKHARKCGRCGEHDHNQRSCPRGQQ